MDRGAADKVVVAAEWVVIAGTDALETSARRKEDQVLQHRLGEQKMPELLMVSNRQENFQEFVEAMAGHQFTVQFVGSQEAALAVAEKQKVDLVVIDEALSGRTGLEVAKKLIAVNPMLNCALVSKLAAKDFHETSEGLGILMQLSDTPAAADAEKLYERLGKIAALI